MTSDQIKKVQQFIKDQGLAYDPLVMDIMAADPDQQDQTEEFFKSIQGKYLKFADGTAVRYRYIHPNIKYITRFGSKLLHVVEDRYDFFYATGVENIHVSFTKELNHVLSSTGSSTGLHRYDGYEVISQDVFEKEIQILEEYVGCAKQIAKSFGLIKEIK